MELVIEKKSTQNIAESSIAKAISEATTLVNQLDFTQQNDKLINVYGWSAEQVSTIETLYRQWLVLHKVYAHNTEVLMAPNEILDEYWHTHILDTRKYMSDCYLVFGSYLHHYPYFGLNGEEDAKKLDSAFEVSSKLYSLHFGVDLSGEACGCAAQNCR